MKFSFLRVKHGVRPLEISKEANITPPYRSASGPSPEKMKKKKIELTVSSDEE